jgi:hypothetical protein
MPKRAWSTVAHYELFAHQKLCPRLKKKLKWLASPTVFGAAVLE